MATLKHGINGRPFSGRMCTVIGVVKNGQQQIRGLHKKRTTRISEKEKHNRRRFATAQQWLKPILPFLRAGFSVKAKTTTSFVRAVGNTLKNAVIDEENNLRIDPQLVSVSQGELTIPNNIQISAENRLLMVTWDAVQRHEPGADDQVLVLAYDPTLKFATGTFRGA